MQHKAESHHTPPIRLLRPYPATVTRQRGLNWYTNTLRACILLPPCVALTSSPMKTFSLPSPWMSHLTFFNEDMLFSLICFTYSYASFLGFFRSLTFSIIFPTWSSPTPMLPSSLLPFTSSILLTSPSPPVHHQLNKVNIFITVCSALFFFTPALKFKLPICLKHTQMHINPSVMLPY